MLDLQVLVQTQTRLKSQRNDQGDGLCQQGFIALAKAEESGFHSKDELKKALGLFIQAIRQNRQYIPSYLGLSYLLALLGQHDKAMKYINAALTISPEDADAQELKKYLSNPYEYAPDEAEADDMLTPEVLFDRLERNIYSLLPEVQTYPLKLTEAVQNELPQLKINFAALNERYQSNIESLQSISETFQVLNLQSHLGQIKEHLDAYAHQIQLLEVRQRLDSRILSTINAVTKGFKAYQKSPDSKIEEQLEAWLEETERYSRGIQALSVNVEVVSLEGFHQRLLVLIESFQDYIEFN